MSIEAAFFGSLGRDGELKTSKAGKEYLRLAVRIGDGEGAQWISVAAFDDEAIARADRLVKGASVYIEGTLKLDTWEGKDGALRAGLSVMSWHCRLAQIGKNRPPREGARERKPAVAADFHDDDIGF
jgi:single-strand DNA-binding protein